MAKGSQIDGDGWKPDFGGELVVAYKYNVHLKSKYNVHLKVMLSTNAIAIVNTHT